MSQFPQKYSPPFFCFSAVHVFLSIIPAWKKNRVPIIPALKKTSSLVGKLTPNALYREKSMYYWVLFVKSFQYFVVVSARGATNPFSLLLTTAARTNSDRFLLFFTSSSSRPLQFLCIVSLRPRYDATINFPDSSNWRYFPGERSLKVTSPDCCSHDSKDVIKSRRKNKMENKITTNSLFDRASSYYCDYKMFKIRVF